MSEANARAETVGTLAENMRYLLLQSIGRQIVAEFWFGGEAIIRRCGTLTAVGIDYLLMTDEVNRQEIAGELSALRLVTLCGLGGSETSDAAQTEASEPKTAEQPGAVTPVMARTPSQAAFNYAKRMTRKLD